MIAEFIMSRCGWDAVWYPAGGGDPSSPRYEPAPGDRGRKPRATSHFEDEPPPDGWEPSAADRKRMAEEPPVGLDLSLDPVVEPPQRDPAEDEKRRASVAALASKSWKLVEACGEAQPVVRTRDRGTTSADPGASVRAP